MGFYGEFLIVLGTLALLLFLAYKFIHFCPKCSAFVELDQYGRVKDHPTMFSMGDPCEGSGMYIVRRSR